MGLIWNTKPKIQLTNIVYENIYRYNKLNKVCNIDQWHTRAWWSWALSPIAGCFKINLCSTSSHHHPSLEIETRFGHTKLFIIHRNKKSFQGDSVPLPASKYYSFLRWQRLLKQIETTKLASLVLSQLKHS